MGRGGEPEKNGRHSDRETPGQTLEPLSPRGRTGYERKGVACEEVRKGAWPRWGREASLFSRKEGRCLFREGEERGCDTVGLGQGET